MKNKFATLALGLLITTAPAQNVTTAKPSFPLVAPEYRQQVLTLDPIVTALGQIADQLSAQGSSLPQVLTQLLSGAVQPSDLARQYPALAPLLTQPELLQLFKSSETKSLASRVITVPGRIAGQPDLKLYVYEPKERQANSPAIYNIHGGGYIIGQADEGEDLVNLANRSGAVVYSVEYRLATVAAFPGPVEDTYTGLAYLFDHATELGIDPNKIVTMGGSAGGGLNAALNLLVRDRGQYRPAGQVLIFPMLDHRTGTDASPYRYDPYAGEFMWTKALNRMGWQAMQGGQDVSWNQLAYFSPARALDVSRLPTTFIATGSIDLFAHEDVDYAQKLMRQGVATELHVYNGLPHGFMGLKTVQTEQYMDDLILSIKRMFAQVSTSR